VGLPSTKRSYGSFEEMKKGTSAMHVATFFFYQKGHGAQKKGHGDRRWRYLPELGNLSTMF
jgi:hypothetical protein